mmetsp:Transcript_19419/g.33013  ORF Transcript_19419/g.33013 Transcript_19419/m.33013 type:complete len:371 (+) Transcript_19419:503-1615(+)
MHGLCDLVGSLRRVDGVEVQVELAEEDELGQRPARHGVDGGEDLLPQRQNVVGPKVDRRAVGLGREVVRSQQLRTARRGETVHPVHLPRALAPLRPRPHARRVEPRLAARNEDRRVPRGVDWDPRPQLHRLPSRHERAVLEAGAGGEVGASGETDAGLVERVEADDVGLRREQRGDAGERGDVVALQVRLDPLAAHLELWREVVPREEERVHRRRRQLEVVGGPLHWQHRRSVLLVHGGAAGGVHLGHVEAGDLEGPAGRSVAAAEAGPRVHVRVDEDGDAVRRRLAHDREQVGQVLLVVLARPLVLDCLPRDEEPDEGEAPEAEAREVLVGAVEWEGPAHEGHVAVVVEAVLARREGSGGDAVRRGRKL